MPVPVVAQTDMSSTYEDSDSLISTACQKNETGNPPLWTGVTIRSI